MKLFKNLIGGFAGALALNILHETVKRLDHDAPQINLIGEEAISNTMESAGAEPLHGNALFAAALAGDLISNALYYSLIGNGKSKNVLLKGAGYGIGAGIGALVATKPLGLDDVPVTKTNETKALTVAYYLFGGIVAALAIKALRK